MSAVAIDGGDMFALAKLMLDADEAHANADAEELRAARQTQRQELERQVEALHDAADDVRIGAFTDGGLAAVGGTLSVLGTATEPIKEKGASGVGAAFDRAEHTSKLEIRVGQALSRLAQPTSALVGSSAEKDAEARVKRHEALAADAGSRADEAAHHRDRVLENEDRTLSTVQSTLQDEAAGRLALIANA